MTEDDALLVRRCLEGETAAFEVLVERYQGPLFNTALRMVQDYADAQDITQGALIKAYENLASYDPGRKMFSWLYRIVINESLNFLGRKKRFAPLDDAAAVADEDTGEGSAEEAGRLIDRALRCLRPEYRAVVVLKHIEGLSYSEISQILGIPEKKVKSRLFSARMMMRGILGTRGAGAA